MPTRCSVGILSVLLVLYLERLDILCFSVDICLDFHWALCFSPTVLKDMHSWGHWRSEPLGGSELSCDGMAIRPGCIPKIKDGRVRLKIQMEMLNLAL